MNQRGTLLLLGCWRLFRLQTCVSTSRELVLELLNSSSRIDVLELAGVERMASIANIHFQFLADTAGLKRIAATTGDQRFLIVGVDSVFHNTQPTSQEKKELPPLGWMLICSLSRESESLAVVLGSRKCFFSACMSSFLSPKG